MENTESARTCFLSGPVCVFLRLFLAMHTPSQPSGFLPDLEADQFSYDLPDDRIARYPVEPRDSSRLLVWKNNRAEHHTFTDLPAVLPPGSLLLFNDTRVIPARLHVQKESGTWIELLLHDCLPDPADPSAAVIASVMAGNKKKWKEGETLTLKGTGQESELRFSWSDRAADRVRITWQPAGHSFMEVLAEMGEMPIPPYLNREAEARDKSDYQTVYARTDGAVAAPTAGLHFTGRVLEELDRVGAEKAWLTLHVGLGTFKPMKSERVADHDMHPEEVILSRNLMRQLAGHKGPRIAVGTTSVRSLESWYWLATEWRETGVFPERLETHQPYEWAARDASVTGLAADLLADMEARGLEELRFSTRLYLMPGYRYRVTDGLITNFHQPRSTLMVLVASFLGGDHWKTVYRTALGEGYRFLSYGDSSLLLPG